MIAKIKENCILGSQTNRELPLVNKTNIDKTAIFDKIRSGEAGRNEVVKSLYKDEKLRGMVYKFVLSHNGEQADAKSVFNYSLAKFIRAVVENKDLLVESGITQYIYGIARYTWYDELNVRKKNTISSLDKISEIPEDVSYNNRVELLERKQILGDLLSKMRRNCKEVLLLWAGGYSMEEIAEKLGYKSYHMSKKKKYECMRQLLDYIDTNPSIKESFQ